MKAAMVHTLTGPQGIAIADIAEPKPRQGEVAIKVKAAALNFLDTLMCRGKYQFKPDLPFSPAGEIAGEVVGLGAGVVGFEIGDRVCAYIGWGGAREIVTAKAEALVRIPDDVSDVVAAGVNVTYGTAMNGLVQRGRISPGETVAVLGASGGAGLAAIEVAKRLGARVVAVASRADKLEICRAHGADALVNYSEGDLKQGLRDATDGRGPDIIYDCVGGQYAEPALRAIAWHGRYLVVGFAAGEIPAFPLNLILLKCCDVAGVFWGEEATRQPSTHGANIAQVLAWIASGALSPRIHTTMPLGETAEAIKMLDRREVAGKVIITLD
ncbi:MAG: NADPH:quinone oxidoreductase family protein [Hyphomicrobiaceae bacterium]|nr:NADPH:quinone oxidoreductase family protein [Hyphomicrobiaceae bacterium]